MKKQLTPSLPFERTALQPHMSEDQVHYHFDIHTKKYFDKTNELIKGTLMEGLSLDELNKRIQRTKGRTNEKLVHNVSQAWNHQFFWDQLGTSTSEPHELIEKHLETLKKEVSDAIADIFGSGWVWVVQTGDKFEVKTTPNGDQPSGKKILAIDVWEHAFYVDYPGDKDTYTDNFWKIVNWNTVNERITAEANI